MVKGQIWLPPTPQKTMTDKRSEKTAEFQNELNMLMKRFEGDDFSLMDAVAVLENAKFALLLNAYQGLGI